MWLICLKSCSLLSRDLLLLFPLADFFSVVSIINFTLIYYFISHFEVYAVSCAYSIHRFNCRKPLHISKGGIKTGRNKLAESLFLHDLWYRFKSDTQAFCNSLLGYFCHIPESMRSIQTIRQTLYIGENWIPAIIWYTVYCVAHHHHVI